MSISIKKLTKDDWKIYKEIRLQMLSEEPQAYSQTFEELSNRSDEDWREKTAADNMTILSIWTDGKLAGMNGLFYEKSDTVAIWGMFVRKEFRGLGLGKKLMQEIEKEIRKDKVVTKIQVSVTTSQVAALELYKKLGFKEITRIKSRTKFNGESYDEILMEK
jgi:ribosomal protein S18 acetylase RimI-like enzyme